MVTVNMAAPLMFLGLMRATKTRWLRGASQVERYCRNFATALQIQRTAILFVAPIVAVILMCCSPLWADVTGKVLGVVVDSSGAVVPAATVTLRNPDTGLSRTTTTDSTGSYEFLEVPTGQKYVVEASKPGFQTATQTGIALLVNQVFQANFRLQVGSATQNIEVTANPVQVESTSTQLGDVIESTRMTEMPLNGRSYTDLLGLQAGVVPVGSPTQNSQPVSGDLDGGNLAVNGQREEADAFFVNGSPVEESRLNSAAIIPSLDSLEEFRVITNSFDAEYGHFSGSIVNVVTKSGSNQFHGNAYEFLRNTDLDAKNYFNRARGIFRQNIFGGTIGGPIIKDRLFFFGDYQGTQYTEGIASPNLPVPSASERTGNFSDVNVTGFAPLTGVVRGSNVPGSDSMNQVLSTRLGYTVSNGEPYWISGCNTQADALAGMCVFPGQIIPQAAWSPAAKGMLSYIPTANGSLAGQPVLLSNTNSASTLSDNKFGVRIDLNTQRTGNWTMYYHYDGATVVNPFTFANVAGFDSATDTLGQFAQLRNTRTFGSKKVNEAGFDYLRLGLTNNTPSQGLLPNGYGSIGIDTSGNGLLAGNPAVVGVPQVSLAQLGINFGVENPTLLPQNHGSADESFSLILGKHTMKFGGLFMFDETNARYNSSTNGYFGFEGGETGNDFADFLLGAPDSFQQGSQTQLAARTKYAGVFAQDSYKIKSNVTVNYGLRWEFSMPWYDRLGRLDTFVPGEQSIKFPDAPTGYVFPGDPGIPKTVTPTRYDNFAPRLGIAYSPNFTGGFLGKITGGPGKTSIRSAFGIFYTTYGGLGAEFISGAAPWGIYFVDPGPAYLEEPYQSRVGATIGQRFPYVAPPLSGSATFSFKSFMPIGTAPGYKIDDVLPFAEDYNLSIQRQLRKTMILTLAYVGTQGHHLMSFIENNPGNGPRCLQIRALYIAAGQSGSACGPFGEDVIYNLNGQTFNGTRPYSVTSGRYLSDGDLDFLESEWFSTQGISKYNSLQVTLEKRAGAWTFLGAYTWSKSFDNGSGINDYINPFYPNKLSLSQFDMEHNLVISYNYDLPLQHLANSSQGVGRMLLGGWNLSGITRFTTGFPVSLSESDDQSLCGCEPIGSSRSVDIPIYNGGPLKISNPRTSATNPNNQYFSALPFSQEQLGVPSTSSRRFFSGPGIDDWDAALRKTTRITEGKSLEFRVEFFNLFNHAQFLNPSGNYVFPGSGIPGSAGNFGQVTSARDPRIGQVALKLAF